MRAEERIAGFAFLVSRCAGIPSFNRSCLLKLIYDADLKKAIVEWEEFIKQNALLKDFSLYPHTEPKNFDIQKEFELEPNRKIWLGVKS